MGWDCAHQVPTFPVNCFFMKEAMIRKAHRIAVRTPQSPQRASAEGMSGSLDSHA